MTQKRTASLYYDVGRRHQHSYGLTCRFSREIMDLTARDGSSAVNLQQACVQVLFAEDSSAYRYWRNTKYTIDEYFPAEMEAVAHHLFNGLAFSVLPASENCHCTMCQDTCSKYIDG